jgi:hypothetical protein
MRGSQCHAAGARPTTPGNPPFSSLGALSSDGAIWMFKLFLLTVFFD